VVEEVRRAAVVLLLLVPGCATRTVAPPPVPAATPAPRATPLVPPPPAPLVPPPPPAVPKSVTWTRESAEHRAVFLQTYALATRTVEATVAARRLAPGTWAVVADADETVIDNSLAELEGVTGKSAPYPEGWRAWVARQEATALPGAVAFFGRVRELGGVVAIVTNRSQRECPDTDANLRKVAIPFDALLCKGENSDKNPRFQALAAGTAVPGLGKLEIVAFLGDNIYDFPDLSQAVRDRDDAAFAEFGRRFFVLPNPMYGSWVPAQP
jgi:5'-nucleotidase (lipoprotein e(P4) family)